MTLVLMSPRPKGNLHLIPKTTYLQSLSPSS
jgi:hypothetical protein